MAPVPDEEQRRLKTEMSLERLMSAVELKKWAGSGGVLHCTFHEYPTLSLGDRLVEWLALTFQTRIAQNAQPELGDAPDALGVM